MKRISDGTFLIFAKIANMFALVKVLWAVSLTHTTVG